MLLYIFNILVKTIKYYTDPGEPILYINGTGKTTQEEIMSSCVISDISYVVFQGNITEVGRNSFRDFINLKNISFVDSIKKIGEYAFHGCSKLTDLIFPNSVEIIQNNALSNCKSLSRIIFPQNLVSIIHQQVIEFSPVTEFVIINGVNFWVSSSKTVLIQDVTAVLTVHVAQKIIIPKEVEILSYTIMQSCDIDELSFEEGSNLHSLSGSPFHQSNVKRIILPHGLKFLGNDPFIKCYKLEYVYIPSTIEVYSNIFSVLPTIVELNESCKVLKKDEKGAIYDSTGKELIYFPPSLESFTIKECVEKFNGQILTSAVGLKDFSVDPHNKNFLSVNNILYNKLGDTLLGFPGGIPEAIISDSCTTIENGAFTMSQVQKVVMGANLKTIGFAPFPNTYNLTEIVLSPKLVTIGDYAFTFSNLENISINLPSTLNYCGVYSFKNTSIKSINFGQTSVSIIKCYTFEHCSNLESVILSQSLLSIENDAFSGCSSLKSIIFPKLFSSLSEKSFMGCISLTNIELNECLINKIPMYCFSGAKIKTINFSKNIHILEQGSFEKCTELEEIDIGDELLIEKIQPSVFYGCTNLKRIYIGKNVKEIGLKAITDAPNLEDIEVSKDNVYYSSLNHILYDKNQSSLISFPGGLETCNIEGKVEKIFEYAFYKCIKLANITMLSTIPLKSIESYTFSGCISLCLITIPQQTSRISDDAFRGCTKLSKVEFGENSLLTEISKGSFRGCDKLKTIIFGANSKLKIISKETFQGCKELQNFVFPKSLEVIGSNAFEDCISLETLEFPPTIRVIGYDAFRGCKGLQTVLYCHNQTLEIEREFSDKAFTDTNIKFIISTINSGSFFCGIHIYPLMDKDCQIGTFLFTLKTDKQFILNISLSMQICIGDKPEDLAD